jgi:hypothetical protein
MKFRNTGCTRRQNPPRTSRLFPGLPQPPCYHHFADQRVRLGILNFGRTLKHLTAATAGYRVPWIRI